jgi:6-phosphogluconolactonase
VRVFCIRWKALLALALAMAGCTGHAGMNWNPSSDTAGNPPTASHDGGSLSDAGSEIDAGVPFVLVSGTDGLIKSYRLNAETGVLTPLSTINGGARPSFLAFNPSKTHVYAVNESSSEISAFAIAPQDAKLTLLNRVKSGGSGPAHLSVDRSGKYVLSSNYGSGHVAVLAIGVDGRVSAPHQTLFAGANAHQIVPNAANTHVFVPVLGDDAIVQYLFDASTGRLTANTPDRVSTVQNAGPRHIAFHPSKPFAYGINENNSSMTAYAYSPATGRLTEIHTERTIPATHTGSNSCAEVWVHPNGKFVYGSNRGHNSIVMFSLGDDGRMTLRGHTLAGIRTPRSFAIDPTGKWMLVANQDSNNVVMFAIDLNTGALTSKGEVATATQPQWVDFVTLTSP